MKKEPKAIFLDIDGTLILNDEGPFDEDIKQIKITKLTIEGETTAEEKNLLQDYFQLNSFSNYFEGIIKGEDKSNGIKMILKETGILLENSIAIGDSINDISALSAVNLGIAMGNACSELKEIAQYITDDCKHGGVGKAIKIMVLG